MITRRAFTLAVMALLVGCGGGGGGSGSKVEVPRPKSPDLRPTTSDPWTLTTVDGSYILTDRNGTVRLVICLASLPGTHVVVGDTVTLYNGGQLPYAIIGDIS